MGQVHVVWQWSELTKGNVGEGQMLWARLRLERLKKGTKHLPNTWLEFAKCFRSSQTRLVTNTSQDSFLVQAPIIPDAYTLNGCISPQKHSFKMVSINMSSPTHISSITSSFLVLSTSYHGPNLVPPVSCLSIDTIDMFR